MRLRAKPYWIWSQGRWDSRFRTREQAEAQAEVLSRTSAGPAFVVEVGVFRYRFLVGFPKDQEASLRELFSEYHGQLALWSMRDMPPPPM